MRLGLRATIHASESAKVVAALLPPGSVVGNSALTESTPSDLDWERLLILGLLNARATNWYASKYMATNLNQHILEAIPLPRLSKSLKTKFDYVRWDNPQIASSNGTRGRTSL